MPPDHPRLVHIRAKLEALEATLVSFPGLPHDAAEAAAAATVQAVVGREG